MCRYQLRARLLMNQTLWNAALQVHRTGNLAEAVLFNSQILCADPRHSCSTGLRRCTFNRALRGSQQIFAMAIRSYPSSPAVYVPRLHAPGIAPL